MRTLSYTMALCSVIALVAVGCGSSDSGGGSPGVATDSGAAGDVPQADSSSSTDTSVGSDTTPSGDGSVGPPACPATIADGKLADFNDPASASHASAKEGVRVTGVVATSGKFLVSKSKTSLKCLYGVFVADANATFAPYSGALLVSEGTLGTKDAEGDVTCSEGDLVPTDIKPGDVLTATGVYDPFGPKAGTCAAATPPVADPVPAKMNQITTICALNRTGTGTVPAPAEVTPSQIQGGGTDVEKYEGGLVVVKGVTAAAAADKFGAFTLTGSSLSVTDKIYYRGKGTGPVVAAGDAFTQIVGEVYLDFCTWSLAPRALTDFNPEPTGTTGDAGTDAATDAATDSTTSDAVVDGG